MSYPDQDRAGTASRVAERAEVLVPWREILLAALAYVCLLAVAYSNVFFQGKSLVYTDNYNPFDFRFLAQNYGDGFVPRSAWADRHLLQYANFHDPGAAWWQWEPATEFLRTAIRTREFPLWDPYTGTGTQALANLTSGLFYPPYLPVVLAGNTSFLKNGYFLTTLLGAGLFTYLFLRKHALSREASFLGGVVFIFCGGLAQNVGSLIGQTAECLPLALFVTRRFLDRPSAGRGLTLASIFAMISLASFPPVLIGLFGFTAVYAAAAVSWDSSPDTSRRQRLFEVTKFFLWCGLGAGMVAFLYVPFLALMRATPQFASLYRYAALSTIKPAALYQLFSPVLAGGGKIFDTPVLNTRWFPEMLYVGLGSIALAFLAGPSRRRSANLLFWVTAASTAVLLLKLLGIEPVQSIGRLPFLKHVHFAFYFGIFLDFAVAILAALRAGAPARGAGLERANGRGSRRLHDRALRALHDGAGGRRGDLEDSGNLAWPLAASPPRRSSDVRPPSRRDVASEREIPTVSRRLPDSDLRRGGNSQHPVPPSALLGRLETPGSLRPEAAADRRARPNDRGRRDARQRRLGLRNFPVRVAHGVQPPEVLRGLSPLLERRTRSLSPGRHTAPLRGIPRSREHQAPRRAGGRSEIHPTGRISTL